MRMISKIMWSMRDTGLLDGMSDEDLDTVATAALEALHGGATFNMSIAGSKEWLADPAAHNGTFGVANDTFDAMIYVALNE